MNSETMKKYEDVIRSKSGVLYIKGAPGTAKSALIAEIAKNMNLRLFDFRGSEVDSNEIIGIPRPIEKNGYQVMSYFLPEWAVDANNPGVNPKTGKDYEGSMIFFDELNRSSLAVRQAMMKMLNERKIGTHFSFNDNVYFSAAGNLGDKDGCEVEDLDPAMNNRLCIMDHVLTVAEWVDYAESINLNQFVVGFLKNNVSKINEKSEKSDAFGSYRSWTNLAKFLDSKNCDTADKILQQPADIGTGYVGTAFLSFARYLENLNMISVRMIIDNYDSVKDTVKSLTRSRKSELLNELSTRDIKGFKEINLQNVIKFFKECSEDEVANVFCKWLSAADYSDKDLLGKINNLLNDYDPSKKFKESLKKYSNA